MPKHRSTPHQGAKPAIAKQTLLGNNHESKNPDDARTMSKNPFLGAGRRAVGRRKLVCDWSGSALCSESTLHQLSPYIGKVKSSMASSLIAQFTSPGQLVYEPFSGSGTVAFEAWTARRRIIANDLSPYAYLLTRAKLFPCRSLDQALAQVEAAAVDVAHVQDSIDLRRVPRWVRQFFHPETLRETIAWVEVLKAKRYWFLLASLLGILHHQRPGFLSFPSSHTVPYLRLKKFPRYRFPQLYKYRALRERLEAKVQRAFRRVPLLDFAISRSCYRSDAAELLLTEPADAIITSPPYMRLLDYGKDNRLRLWFLGSHDWRALDRIVSPRKAGFLNLMRRCFVHWQTVLKPGGFCVLVIGDASGQLATANLPELVTQIATDEVGGYLPVCEYTDPIPGERRVRRGIMGSATETIVVLRSTGHHN